ncbi:MAG: hypothetical protein ACREIC_27790, partial [Limisphaerales bacterium]
MKRSFALFLAAAAVFMVVAETYAQSQPSRAIFFSSSQWPPGPALYVSPPGSWSGGSTPAGGGPILSNVLLGKFSQSVPTPPPGASVTLT